MALAHLLSLSDINEPRQRAEFTFWHAEHHQAINARLLQLGTVMPTYILDPVQQPDFLAFLQRHADLHARINATLNLPGQDVTGLDPSSLDSVNDWVQLNFKDHQAWELRVGLPR